jgi:hypothetical protein
MTGNDKAIIALLLAPFMMFIGWHVAFFVIALIAKWRDWD